MEERKKQKCRGRVINISGSRIRIQTALQFYTDTVRMFAKGQYYDYVKANVSSISWTPPIGAVLVYMGVKNATTGLVPVRYWKPRFTNPPDAKNYYRQFTPNMSYKYVTAGVYPGWRPVDGAVIGFTDTLNTTTGRVNIRYWSPK